MEREQVRMRKEERMEEGRIGVAEEERKGQVD